MGLPRILTFYIARSCMGLNGSHNDFADTLGGSIRVENITMRFDTENKYFAAIHGDVPQVGEFSIRRDTEYPLADFKTVEKCPIELSHESSCRADHWQHHLTAGSKFLPG